MNADELDRLIGRPAWQADAACRGMDPERWFPTRGESLAELRAICRTCDVQVECLTYAINMGEKHGVWGGMGERQRRRIRRQVAA